MKRFAAKKTSGVVAARCVMVMMFGLLTVFSAAGQETRKRIDTPDGLNMRDKPSISGTVLLTIPGGDIVTPIREEGNAVTIGDRTGKWTEVIWRNNRGWVFGGYLAAVDPGSAVIPIVYGVTYKAEHVQGKKYTDAGIYSNPEFTFVSGNRIKYSSPHFFFDGKTISIHEGMFDISGNKINVIFASGIERDEIGPAFAAPGYTPTEKSVPGFNMTLIWVDELDGFMTEYSYNQVKSGNYILDRSSRQYKYETDATFDYIGYFVRADLVLVEGGTFTMGDTAGGGDSEENPTHSVTVSGFYMNKYETTVGEFRSFIQETGYKTTAETSGGGYVYDGSEWEQKADANWKNPYFSQTDKDPVVLVSWYDAAEYCNWKSRKEGLTNCYSISGTNVTCNWSANGYRLPTEAEWEYAAKGGKLSKGYKYAGGNSEGSVAWYGSNSGGKTQPVGTKSANELGIYDMSGNVWEWCWDWYESYGSSSQTDPRGASSGSVRVDRGGSWYYNAVYLRVSNRYNLTPGDRIPDIGFRPVRTK